MTEMPTPQTFDVANIDKVRHQKRRVFTDTHALPWTEWVMERTWFKLLQVDIKTGGFTMLLKVDANNTAPVHHHIGAIEGWMVEGEFGYGDDRGGAGAYVWEETGAIHMPTTRSGFIMLTIVHGPLAGYNPDGTLSGIIDAELMLKLARDAGAADHIAAPQLYEFA